MKQKLTFVYTNGQTYTTRRNVIFHFENDTHFIYEVGEKINGIYQETSFYINKSELSMIIFHVNDDGITMFKKFNQSTRVSLMVETSFKEDGDEYITSINFGAKY